MSRTGFISTILSLPRRPSLSRVPLELPQQAVAALDRIVQRSLRILFAGEDRFEILGDNVSDLHQIAEAQPARILGRRFCRHLDDRDLATRVLVVEPGGFGRG
jgi:hypothetical protein